MAGYRLRIFASAEADVLALPFPLRRQVNHRICQLKLEPLPEKCEALGEGRYRFRLHGCRILYSVDESRMLVTIWAVRL